MYVDIGFTYIYMHSIYMCACVCVYIYIHIQTYIYRGTVDGVLECRVSDWFPLCCIVLCCCVALCFVFVCGVDVSCHVCRLVYIYVGLYHIYVCRLCRLKQTTSHN